MIVVKRRKDWRAQLSAVIEDRRRVPFSDKNNCGLFLADCVDAMTGVDFALPFRGKYETVAEGILLLRKAGHSDLCAFLAAYLEEVHPSLARAGDVAAFPSEPTGWAGGIVNGERITVMTEKGLGTVSRDDAMRAFRVP